MIMMDDEHEHGEQVYYVEGMHCPACEILIEKKLLELENVQSVEASTSRSNVVIEYEGNEPGEGRLNELFREDGYSFSTDPPDKAKGSEGAGAKAAGFAKVVSGAAIATGLVILLQKEGLGRLVTVDSSSSLPVFLLLGLVAGFSSCAALVGGIVLSMSKQWGELYSPDDTLKKKLEPHLLFNTGRLISFACLGALLALIGHTLSITPTVSAVLVIAVSIIMIVLALQMLDVRFLRKLQFTMPRFITRYIADEQNFKSRYMPFAMGALTFFLPCGFTITAQSFALISGNPLQGGLIMLFFALGTLPMLLVIGFSSVKFQENPKLAGGFFKVAGVLVLVFALFSINNQLVLLNKPNLSDLFEKSRAVEIGTSAELPPVVNGRQVIKMEASADGYSPDSFTVRAGVPVRWEIIDVGTSGCTNRVIAGDLFSGEIALTPGKTSVKEFTPETAGEYRFSCWMGMVNGNINVVDEDSPGNVKKTVKENTSTTPGKSFGCCGQSSSTGKKGCQQ